MSAPLQIDPALAAEVGVCPRCVQPGEHADDAACVVALVAAYEHMERAYADAEGEADDLFAALVEETARRLFAEERHEAWAWQHGHWVNTPAPVRREYRERATALARATARRRLAARARAATGRGE